LDVEMERNLVASARNGDKDAYGRLVRAHSGRVFAICLGMRADRHDAEDMSQQAFLRGFMQIRTLRNSEKFATWIAQIARNSCIDLIRRRRPQAVSVPACHNDRDDERTEGLRLGAVLTELPAQYRVPLLLFYFDGRSTQSIAETLGLTQGAVQTRLSRARRLLRKLMEAREVL